MALGGLLFLLAAGFSLIFGLMRIANLTHGALFMLGAYFGTSVLKGFANPLSTLVPMYAPSMNSAPCVRLAILIRPKMSEKPAARRNSNPPSAMLFSVWIAQYWYCRG